MGIFRDAEDGCSAGTAFGDVATVAEVEADVGDGVLAEEDQIPNPCPFTILAAPERCLLVLVLGVTGCFNAAQLHHAEDHS
jgi:hypothetical protein